MATEKRKGRIAFVKFGGMAAGGTEKYLQIIAANLPKNKYDVDYYYCDAAPYIGSDWKHPDTDASRLEFMKSTGVNLIKFNVGFKDVTIPTHDWKKTNFFEIFDESNYDIVMTGRAGHPEYPFTQIKETAIVDSIHLPGMVDNQANIAKVIHINQQNADVWVKHGGKADRVTVIYPPVVPPKPKLLPKIELDWDTKNLRKELGIGPDDFVYGLHQRDNEEIFSEWPIGAFASVQKKYPDDVHFVLLGGAKKHLAQGANLKNFHHIPHTGDMDRVWAFLRTLNVYVHGRRDGEVNSQSIAEAMRCGLPIVSHLGATNGHVETIGNAGTVHDDFAKYAADCLNYKENPERLSDVSHKASVRFHEMYDLKTNIGKIEKIYDHILDGLFKEEIPDDEFWDSVWEED